VTFSFSCVDENFILAMGVNALDAVAKMMIEIGDSFMLQACKFQISEGIRVECQSACTSMLNVECSICVMLSVIVVEF